ncbi:hypothetical protein ZWY2020_028587 [Hordeum vulgare]|nr:hypothetical protein ZWY2020_028587 [Hordeum vulgare]
MAGGRRLDGLEHGIAALAGGSALWGRDPLGHEPSGTETETAPCPAVSAVVPSPPCRRPSTRSPSPSPTSRSGYYYDFHLTWNVHYQKNPFLQNND